MYKRSLLVIGGSGFIGGRLVAAVLARGQPVAYSYAHQSLNLAAQPYQLDLTATSDEPLRRCLAERAPQIVVAHTFVECRGADAPLMPALKPQVLFGTANQAKLDHVAALAADWPVTIVSPQSVGLHLQVIEDAPTVAGNACKKALAYATAADLPAFAIDAGLFVEQFPPEKQPGIFVRRIYQNHRHVADDDLLHHYRTELQAVGGSSAGHWQIAVALAWPTQRVVTEEFSIATHFVAQPSPIRIPGAPLSSLMRDPLTNRYYSEMSYGERPDSLLLRQALQKLFQYL